jgi:hypothetical protein
MSFKCQFCERYCSSRQGYSQHMKMCFKANDMSLDNNDFQQIKELQRENLQSDLECETINISSISEYTTNISFNTILNEEGNERFLSDQLQNYSFNSEESPKESEVSDEEEESIESEKLEEPKKSEDLPNDAYSDLMKLVIKHNLNNKAGNAIIKFFNKYSNLSISPLPKNIEAGRKYMDKIINKKLSCHKHLILNHNNTEYYLYYRPVKYCIQKLLSNPELSHLFLYKYEPLKVTLFLTIINIRCILNYYLSLFVFRSIINSHMENKILELGGNKLKILYHLKPVFYL